MSAMLVPGVFLMVLHQGLFIIHKLCFIATNYPVRLQLYLRKNNDYPQRGYLIFSIYRIGHLFPVLKHSGLNKNFSRSVTISQVLFTNSQNNINSEENMLEALADRMSYV